MTRAVAVDGWSPDGQYLIVDAGAQKQVLNASGIKVGSFKALQAGWLDAETLLAFKEDLEAVGIVRFYDRSGNPAGELETEFESIEVATGQNVFAGTYPARADLPQGDTYSVWDGGSLSEPRPGHPLAWSPDASRLVVVIPTSQPSGTSSGIRAAGYPGFYGMPVIVDRDGNQVLELADWQSGSVSRFVFSPDGRYLAGCMIGAGENAFERAMVIDVQTGAVDDSGFECGYLAWTAEPALYSWPGPEMTMRWTPAAGAEALRRYDSDTMLAPAPDGSLAYWSDLGDPTLRINSRGQVTQHRLNGRIFGVEWRPDSQALAIISADNTLTILATSDFGPAVVDCRTLDVPEPEGEQNTGLALELGLVEIDYNDDGYGNGVRLNVEFLDPACIEHPVIGPMIDHVMSDIADYPGCEYFGELLRDGAIGYRGQPISAASVGGYLERWCGTTIDRFSSGAWRALPDSPIEDGADATGVWTGEEFIVWGSAGLADGAAYNPATDTWRPLPDGPIGPGDFMAAFWTGDVVIAWHGGRPAGPDQPDGGIFDPATDSWTPITPGPLNSDYGQGVAWSGSELLVLSPDMRAAAYDPATKTWRGLPSPPLRAGAVFAEWTGTEWLVLGYGPDRSTPAALAAFDPVSGKWRQLAESPYTEQHLGLEGIWTGESWLFLAGDNSFAYDRVADQWRSVDDTPCPVSSTTGVWTGSVVIGSGGAYSPETGACADFPEEPESVWYSDAIAWTGTQLLLWGGTAGPGDPTTTDGAAFTPAD